MARQDGYSSYSCDRCKAQKYALPNSSEALMYSQVERITADGVSVSRLLCTSCAAKYRELARKHDGEFLAFMKNDKE